MRPSDYDVFLSSLEDFKMKVKEAGFEDKVVYLDRKDQYRFKVKGPKDWGWLVPTRQITLNIFWLFAKKAFLKIEHLLLKI